MRQFLLFICLLSLFVYAKGQDYKRINTLRYQIKVEQNATNKVDYCLEISDLLIQSDPKAALNYADQALSVSESIHYNKGLINAYHLKGFIANFQGDYPKAIVEHANAERIGQNYSNYKEIAISRIYQAENLWLLNEHERAKALFQNAIEIGEKTKSKEVQARAKLALGKGNKRDNKNFLAQQYLLEAADLLRNQPDSELKSEALYELGILQKELKEYETSEVNLLGALRISEKLGNIKRQTELNFHIGMLKNELGAHEESLVYLKTSLGLAQEVKDQNYIKECYQIISETYESSNNFKEAYEYLKYYSAIKDTREINELKTQMELVKKDNLLKESQALKKEEDARHQAELDQEKFNRRVLLIVSAVICCLAIFLMISLRQRDRINTQLEKAKDEAEQSRKEKEEFFAYTNHEIRTPLNAVVGMSKILGETELNKDQQQYLKTIKSSAQNILFLVNDVLDLSKIEQGAITFEKITFSIKEICDQIIQSLSFKKFEKDVELIFECGPNVPDLIIGDPVRFNQILLNLSDNALKFTEKGFVKIKLHLIESIKEKCHLGFEVIDTGVGIENDKIHEIFETYKQAHESTTRQYGGTGLGLSICKLLVEAMGGDLKVESVVGEGSAFKFSLWLEKSSNEDRTVADYSSSSKKLFGGLKVLVVDDNLLNREIFADLITGFSTDIQIEMATNGLEALTKVKKDDYDLVMMDIQMPVMDGYKASSKIRDLEAQGKAKTVIIAMTAHVMEGVAEKCAEAGMDDAIAKPINNNVLLQKLRALLPDKILDTNSKVEEKSTLEVEEEADSETLTSLIDLTHLSEMTGNNEDRINKYLSLIKKNLPVDTESLVASLEASDFEQVQKSSHKIKGSLGYLGVKSISEQILNLESCISLNLDEETIKADVYTVEKEIMLILKELNSKNL